jgi:hypothetical protein
MRAIAETPIVGRLVLTAARSRTVLSYIGPTFVQAARWLLRSRELANFTYALTPLNREYLAVTLSQVTGTDVPTLRRYMAELDSDSGLREHIRCATAASRERFLADTDRIEFGHRLGWYVVVRALKPGVVVETGVDKGLGSCVLCAALLRNGGEGRAVRYYGTDINPAAGYLLQRPCAAVGKILYGDSIESLQNSGERIDVFVNDSDHSAEYEAHEYDTVAPMLSARAVVLGDNSHATDSLLKFASRTGRKFLFFREEPADYWYPGAGIGMAFGSPVEG